MTVIAGVDVGNATTEVVFVRNKEILGAGRAPTRGRKGDPESLRGAAALVRRVERQAGVTVAAARIAPLRPVDTFTRTLPDVPPPTGGLRVLAAGVPTPGGSGFCVGRPLLLGGSQAPAPGPVVVLVPAGVGYDEAAARIGSLLESGTAVGAALVARDEGVLVANRLPARCGGIPVIDQVDVAAAARCLLLAVEVRRPGHPLTTVADPVALSAALGLGDREPDAAAVVARSVLDYSNAVVGLAASAWPAPAAVVARPRADDPELDDVFTVDLAAVAEAATARRGRLGRAILIAALRRNLSDTGAFHADLMAGLLGIPVSSPLTEPAAARLGASTTPGMAPGALVADFGAGTVDLFTPEAEAIVAGAGDLLTIAVAEVLGVPRAAADWIKRGPCIRVDGGYRYEAEDGTRGFLDSSAPAALAGQLAVEGPGGLLPFSAGGAGGAGGMGPAEWRALRLRLKQATLAASLRRALSAADWPLDKPAQLLLAGGPAGDDELAGVLTRAFPEGLTIGRARVGAALPGGAPLGHRHAVALGLALA